MFVQPHFTRRIIRITQSPQAVGYKKIRNYLFSVQKDALLVSQTNEEKEKKRYDRKKRQSEKLVKNSSTTMKMRVEEVTESFICNLIRYEIFKPNGPTSTVQTPVHNLFKREIITERDDIISSYSHSFSR